MAFSINGFGVTFYGRRLVRPDRSYVTTKWFILACLPIVPLGSARLRDSSRGFSRQEYDVVEETPLDLVQVLNTYFYVYALIPSCLYWVFVKPPLAPAWLPPMLAVAYSLSPMLVLALLPHFLRLFSKQARPRSNRQKGLS